MRFQVRSGLELYRDWASSFGNELGLASDPLRGALQLRGCLSGQFTSIGAE
jgi:hypothetical protein